MKASLLAAICGVALACGPAALAKETAGDQGKPRMAPRKVLTQFDTDKNGKIEGAEAEALRKAYAGDLKKQLAPFDRDSDGRLDDREIAAIRMKASPKAGGLPRAKTPADGKSEAKDAPVE